MSNTSLIRIGAAAAALFVLAQIASALLLPVEPLWTEDPAEGVRVVADAAGWDAIWLVHLAGALLAIVALAVVGRTFVDGPAREWARVGDVLLALTGAVAVVAVLVGAALEEIADAWATAAPPSREAYLASYDTTHTVWTLVDLGGTVGLGLYLTTFAAAVLSSRVYGRWLGWASAAAAPLIVVGLVVELRSTVGTYVATVGILLFMAVMIGLARALWRRSASVGHAPLIQAEAGR
jgi:hypothetical protein